MKSQISVVVLLAAMGVMSCGSSESGDDDASGGTTAAGGGGAGGAGGTTGTGTGTSTGTSTSTGGTTSASSTTAATVLAPIDGSAWALDCYDDDPTDTKTYYVARGGGVASDAKDVRVSSRLSAIADGYGTVQMGVRCVTTGTPDPSVEWVAIQAGTFMMGCSAGDTECDPNESPAHSVTVGAFSMMKKEASPADSPIVARGVSYDAAVEYCTGLGGRLPTEAEWEYAARAGTTGSLPCTESCSLESIAWYADNIEAQNLIDQTDAFSTTSGGQKAANPWGLYDMLGNVPEWVQDCYHATY